MTLSENCIRCPKLDILKCGWYLQDKSWTACLNVKLGIKGFNSQLELLGKETSFKSFECMKLRV